MNIIIRKLYKLPVNLVLTFALLMLGANLAKIGFPITFKYQAIVSVVVFFSGAVIILVGGYAFRKANTTFDPSNPEQASKLVTNGIYKLSRNPMYVGFFLWVLSFAIFSGNPVNLLLLPIFVILVNKLYIIPEEKALEKIFDNEFQEYKQNVRRWI